MLDPIATYEGGDLLKDGWQIFPLDPNIEAWRTAAARLAPDILANDALRQEWLQCQGTWFVGVDVLPNDAQGRLPDGPMLTGNAIAALQTLYGTLPPLHKAQLSTTFPGYPKPRDGDTEQGFAYRKNRFAAHIDGLLPIGPDKRRHLLEPHLFILGITLDEGSKDTAPLVVWEGSHEIIRNAFRPLLMSGTQTADNAVDLTPAYYEARKTIFETCQSRALLPKPGQAVVLHRLCLHGIGPWPSRITSEISQRSIAYFRPCLKPNSKQWINLP